MCLIIVFRDVFSLVYYIFRIGYFLRCLYVYIECYCYYIYLGLGYVLILMKQLNLCYDFNIWEGSLLGIYLFFFVYVFSFMFCFFLFQDQIVNIL